ncbi:MAG: HAD hydrolase-like protein [Patescibacteria group bacterium]
MKTISNNKGNFILFDFDGVIAASFAAAFEVNKKICPHTTEDDYRKRFEGNVNDWQELNHTKECRPDIDFFDEYIPRMKNEVTLAAGIADILKELSNSYTLIIISSTITSPIQDFAERNHVANYFTEIMGNDVHVSKVEKIKMVFEKYNISSDQCVFITDTLGDIREATKTGVGAIGVTWGFHDRKTLLHGNPFRLVERSADIVLVVADYFNKIKG